MKSRYLISSKFVPLSRRVACVGTMAFILALVFSILSTAGIGCNAYNTSSSDLFFPVQKEPDPSYIYPAALAEGKLVLDNSNLRLKPSWGKGDVWSKGELLVWPYGYSLRIMDKQIQVIDNDGQLVARVGDKIKVGGGEVPAEIVEEYIGQPLPDDCEGPYWLVSEVIEN